MSMSPSPESLNGFDDDDDRRRATILLMMKRELKKQQLLPNMQSNSGTLKIGMMKLSFMEETQTSMMEITKSYKKRIVV